MADQARKRRLYRILFFSDSEQERQRGASILGGLSSYVVESHPTAALAGDIAFDKADVIIVDVAGGELLDSDDIFHLRSHFARTPLVVLAETLDPERIRSIMRLDANDLLIKPVDSKKLIESVEHQVGSTSGAASRAIAVVSTVGGSGGTSIAISIAEALAREADRQSRSTCLIDLDFSSAACGYYLDALNEYDLSEMVDTPNRIDAEFLDIIRKESASNFAVFSFQQPTLTYRRHGDDLVLRMLDILSYQYQSVVIDLPYWNARWKESVLSAVNDVFIVTNPTIPSLKQARDLYRTVTELRQGPKGVTVLVNRFKRSLFSGSISKTDVQRFFKDVPIEFISEDQETLVEAVNCGALPSEIRPRSPFVREVRQAVVDHRKRDIAHNLQAAAHKVPRRKLGLR
jgi:pilus assembly protein CpaE